MGVLSVDGRCGLALGGRLVSDQFVFIVPSKQLVVSRHAMPALTGSGFEWRPFLDPIVAAFP